MEEPQGMPITGKGKSLVMSGISKNFSRGDSIFFPVFVCFLVFSENLLRIQNSSQRALKPRVSEVQRYSVIKQFIW